MSETTITVAIPYYAGRDYLREAIDSVFAQDDDGWTLAIRDDGERDEAAAVVDALGIGADARVACTANDRNLGMVGNWNACLDAATTPLVTLLHADDALEPGYVRTMRALAASHPEAAVLFGAARIVDAAGRPAFSLADWIKRFYLPRAARGRRDFSLHGEAALCALMRGNFIMCPTACYRLARLDGRRFDARHRQVQDLAFTSRLLMDGETLVGTRATVYAYRRHAAGATARQSDSRLRFDEEFALFEAVAERAESLGWRSAARVARRKTIVRLHLAYRALRELLRLRPGAALRELRSAIAAGSRAHRASPPP